MKTIFSLFLFGALLSAAPMTQVTLTSVGATGVVDSHNDYVGPYTVALNGGSDIYALCVDDKDFSNLNTTWSADVTKLTSSDLSKTYKSGSGTEYKESAFLFNLITKPSADRINIQHAVWDIMDYNITSATQLSSLFTAGTMSKTDGAVSYIDQAMSGYSSMNFSGFELLTANGGARQQEFLVCDPSSAAPEPTTYALLGGGLLALGCSRMLRRKKKTNVATAAPAGLVRVR